MSQREILSLLENNPHRAYTFNELVKKAGIRDTCVVKNLSKLEQFGFIKRSDHRRRKGEKRRFSKWQIKKR